MILRAKVLLLALPAETSQPQSLATLTHYKLNILFPLTYPHIW